jgi:hypothetical protein
VLRNKCFLFVLISHVSHFIPICDLFTHSPSYIVMGRVYKCSNSEKIFLLYLLLFVDICSEHKSVDKW